MCPIPILFSVILFGGRYIGNLNLMSQIYFIISTIYRYLMGLYFDLLLMLSLTANPDK